MTDLPAPPVPADLDLRDCQWMPLDVVRLRDSDLAMVPDAEVFRVSVISWCVAWHQTPAASLPDDDAALARLLGFGRDIKGWRKVRSSGGLRGWIKHSDGRLYHPVVAAKALEAQEQKERSERKRNKDAERLKKWREQRDGNGEGNAFQDNDETRFVAERPNLTLPNRTIPNHNTPPPSGDTGDAPAAATAAPDHGSLPEPPHPPAPIRKVQAVQPQRVLEALRAGNLRSLIRAFGGNVGGSRDAEWARDLDGLSLHQVAVLMSWRRSLGQPIREPSGARKAREDWRALSPDDRRAIATMECQALGIEPPRAA